MQDPTITNAGYSVDKRWFYADTGAKGDTGDPGSKGDIGPIGKYHTTH